MSYEWRKPDEDDALTVSCPVCKAEPSAWCVYVGVSSRAGYETKRLHVQRTHRLWLNRPINIHTTTRPHPALAAQRDWDRRQERQLRAWLRQNVHLLQDPN